MIGDHGKIIYLQRYRSIALFAAILLIISIISAFGMFYFLQKNRTENRFLKETLKVSEKQVDSLRSGIQVLAARLIMAGVEPNLKQLQPDRILADKKANENDVSSETKKVEKKWREKSNLLTLSDFSVRHDSKNNRLNLQVRLDNISGHRVSGHIFMILKNNSESSDTWIVLPEESLENGMPANYQSGRKFSILNYKTIKFRTKQNEQISTLFEAVVFIYDPNGKLLLKQEFPVEI